MNLPLRIEQEQAEQEALKELGVLSTIQDFERWRKRRAKILKRFDYLRDIRFPGWRDRLHGEPEEEEEVA